MLSGWSTTIDPIQLADKGVRLAGTLPLKGMRRLMEMCADEQGSVSVDLQFERDPSNGMRAVHGRIDAHVELVCQRCMGRLTIELHSEPRLTLLRCGEREDLVEAGDALVIEQPITLGDLVEDELLLEVPMVPMHAPDQCPAQRLIADNKPEKEATRANPFSILEKLKQTDR